MPGMALFRLDLRLGALLWIGLIYASIPFVRRLREAFAARWPAEFIGYAVIAIVIGAAALGAFHIGRRKSQVGRADLAWLAGVATVIVLWTRRLMARPEEAVHFLEYGVLGTLLYSALVMHFTDRTVYIAVTLTGILVGTIDELIQWLVPGRFWDFRDIVLNGSAVALVQVVIWRLDKRNRTPVSRNSVSLVCRFAALLVLVFTLCLMATPQRLAHLTQHVPLPGRLATGTDAICEYGYLHAVDDRTSFRSRLSADELVRADSDRAADVAGQLDAARGSRRVSQPRVSPVDDPFLYEFRVHLFARGRNLQRARDHEAGSPARRRLMTNAWRENLILESYFGNTLDQSSFRWRPRMRRRIEAAQDPKQIFVSRAASHLITRVSEGQLRTMLLLLFAALVCCDALLVTRSRLEPPTA
jgi:hypothetical protein